jgi:hypothetical protein
MYSTPLSINKPSGISKILLGKLTFLILCNEAKAYEGIDYHFISKVSELPN